MDLYWVLLSYTIQYIGDVHELGYSMNQRSIGRSLHFFGSIEMSKLSDQHFGQQFLARHELLPSGKLT